MRRLAKSTAQAPVSKSDSQLDLSISSTSIPNNNFTITHELRRTKSKSRVRVTRLFKRSNSTPNPSKSYDNAPVWTLPSVFRRKTASDRLQGTITPYILYDTDDRTNADEFLDTPPSPEEEIDEEKNESRGRMYNFSNASAPNLRQYYSIKPLPPLPIRNSVRNVKQQEEVVVLVSEPQPIEAPTPKDIPMYFTAEDVLPSYPGDDDREEREGKDSSPLAALLPDPPTTDPPPPPITVHIPLERQPSIQKSTSIAENPRASTFIKRIRGGQNIPVYRVALPRESVNLTREFVIQNLPGMDLTNKLGRSGTTPAFTTGVYGDLWSGTRIGAGTKVAIKVMRSNDALESDKRALREFILWSNLNHRNVLPLLGYTFDYGITISFVSEWQQNGNAAEFLVGKSFLEKLKIIYDALNGLCYLHKKDFVHGDFRGNNILVNSNGIGLISDFGLYRMVCATSKDQTPRGNTAWMAPELVHESARHTKASDVWSAGMTILELVSGKRPYHAYPSSESIISAHRRGIKPSKPANFEPSLWDICVKHCWLVDPSMRAAVNFVKVEVAVVISQDVGSSISDERES